MNQEADDDGNRAEEDSNMDPPHMGDDDDDNDNTDTDTGTDDDGTNTETGSDDDDENEGEDEDDADESDDEDARDDESVVVIPTPDDVEHEYTYPQDFEGKSWEDVVPTGHYFRLILDPSCTKIPGEKFRDCIYLIEIVVPEDSCLTAIGQYSFYWCTNLQRITNGLPITLLIIDQSAFERCLSLHGQLVIPPNVTRLGSGAFCTCASLTSVVFQPSITATTLGIGDGCFFNCQRLLSVDLSERIVDVDYLAFCECKSLNRITIRAPNVRFGANVFTRCSSSLTIEAYPWLYPKIFEAMDNSFSNDPSLIYQTFHRYHHRILGEATITDDGVVTRQHPNGRRRRQLHKR